MWRLLTRQFAPESGGGSTPESWAWPVTVRAPRVLNRGARDPIDMVESGHKEPND